MVVKRGEASRSPKDSRNAKASSASPHGASFETRLYATCDAHATSFSTFDPVCAREAEMRSGDWARESRRSRAGRADLFWEVLSAFSQRRRTCKHPLYLATRACHSLHLTVFSEHTSSQVDWTRHGRKQRAVGCAASLESELTIFTCIFPAALASFSFTAMARARPLWLWRRPSSLLLLLFVASCRMPAAHARE